MAAAWDPRPGGLGFVTGGAGGLVGIAIASEQTAEEEGAHVL